MTTRAGQLSNWNVCDYCGGALLDLWGSRRSAFMRRRTTLEIEGVSQMANAIPNAAIGVSGQRQSTEKTSSASLPIWKRCCAAPYAAVCAARELGDGMAPSELVDTLHGGLGFVSSSGSPASEVVAKSHACVRVRVRVGSSELVAESHAATSWLAWRLVGCCRGSTGVTGSGDVTGDVVSGGGAGGGVGGWLARLSVAPVGTDVKLPPPPPPLLPTLHTLPTLYPPPAGLQSMSCTFLIDGIAARPSPPYDSTYLR